MSRNASCFIPILPQIIQPLQEVKLFNKRHSLQSTKPMNLACLLKLSKSQMAESSFRDTVIEEIYELLVEALKCESTSLSFPEMVLPCLSQVSLDESILCVKIQILYSL